VEVADPERIDPEASADRVTRPCPQDGGHEDQQMASVRPATQEREEPGMKAADEQGEDRSGFKRHGASIEASDGRSGRNAGDRATADPQTVVDPLVPRGPWPRRMNPGYRLMRPPPRTSSPR
jgi:hypothetical protein